jgi:hypothetical protein
MAQGTLSGTELEQSLRSEGSGQPSYELEGMLRALPKLGVIQFSPRDCDSWVDLPVELIERADRTGDYACRDVLYPVFRIKFREPSDQTARALLAALYKMLLSHRP